MKYYVDIIKTETGEVSREIDCCTSYKKVERVENGVNINLNHNEYHTEINER